MEFGGGFPLLWDIRICLDRVLEFLKRAMSGYKWVMELWSMISSGI